MCIVGLIDSGICNLDSITRALEYSGAKVYRIADGNAIPEITHLVLPGVGSFKTAMQNLHSRNLINYLNSAVLKDHKPLLGICLGMQLLAEIGLEEGETAGLGFIPGRVVKLSTSKTYRLPHIGWNEVKYSDLELFSEVQQGENFYFVHSYYFECDKKYQVAETQYEKVFSSAIRNRHVMGVQFHPEKSQNAGFQLLKNFLQCKNMSSD